MNTKTVEEMLDEVLDGMEDGLELHQLSREIRDYWCKRKHFLKERREEVRQRALAKLTPEERKALGL